MTSPDDHHDNTVDDGAEDAMTTPDESADLPLDLDDVDAALAEFADQPDTESAEDDDALIDEIDADDVEPDAEAAEAADAPEPDAESPQPDDQADALELDDEAGSITAESVVEAVLFSADAPIKGHRLAEIVGAGDARDIRQHVDALNARYQQEDAAFRIEEIAGGYQMLTLPTYGRWVEKLRKVRTESKLSQAALETLAIIAYRQPVLRVDVEAIRGVAAGDMINRLREMGLVKIAGRAEDVGRPMLYGTTKRFLDVFGLKDLRQLPEVEQLKPPDQPSA